MELTLRHTQEVFRMAGLNEYDTLFAWIVKAKQQNAGEARNGVI